MFIKGQIRNRRQMLEVRDPYTGAVVGSVSRDTPADVDEAISLLSSYDHRLDAEERKRLLVATAAALFERRDEFAALITRESGMCVRDSQKEVARARDDLLVASEEALRIHGEALRFSVSKQSKIAMTIHEPIGVVCAITPFNRPLNQVVVKVGPALAANNSVIVKPSEKTPLTALAFAGLLHDCGWPPEMMAMVTGAPAELGDALVTHAGVDMITFTGGVATGEQIASRVGLKKITMELGGNDPLIVLDDADLDHAARLAATGAFATAGQSCRGVKRVLVMEAVADEFVARLAQEASRIKLGDPRDPDTEMGTLIHEDAARMVERRCQQAVREGAVLVRGGERLGAAFTPTVLDRVPPHTELVQQETMGPVAPVIRVSRLGELAAVANGTEYGLQAGICTKNFEHFETLARALRVGAVNLLEGPHLASPHIPFGGVKKSGIGREGVRYAIREMTTIKTVVIPW
jgi:putative phosphonoacetaldehyde dehydrogenase